MLVDCCVVSLLLSFVVWFVKFVGACGLHCGAKGPEDPQCRNVSVWCGLSVLWMDVGSRCRGKGPSNGSRVHTFRDLKIH